jgi:hypothetical protein
VFGKRHVSAIESSFCVDRRGEDLPKLLHHVVVDSFLTRQWQNAAVDEADVVVVEDRDRVWVFSRNG